MQVRSRLKLEKPESVFDKALEEELTSYVTDLSRLLNKGIKFAENLNAEIVSYTSNAVADTEDTINHTLGRVPSGYLALHRSKAGIIYQGPATGTAWTASAIYVKCNVASTVFSLMIF